VHAKTFFSPQIDQGTTKKMTRSASAVPVAAALVLALMCPAVADSDARSVSSSSSSSGPIVVTLFLGGRRSVAWLNETGLCEEIRTHILVVPSESVRVCSAIEGHNGLTIVLELESLISAKVLVYQATWNATVLAKTVVLRYSVGASLGNVSWTAFFGDEGDPVLGKAIAIVVPVMGTLMLAIIIAVMVSLVLTERAQPAKTSTSTATTAATGTLAPGLGHDSDISGGDTLTTTTTTTGTPGDSATPTSGSL
jgi:hypothetical protein